MAEEPSELSLAEPAAAPVAPAGLPDDFTAIYTAHSQPIFYLALRLLGDPSQAQDATHDVFVKAYRKLGEFRGDADVRTWLYRITLNHCSNLRQSWAARNIHTAADDTVFDRIGAASENPLRVLETKELGERIQTALDGLPNEYRVLLLLVADEELSYEQIGQLTQQTADAVRGKLHRARKAFTASFAKTA